MSSSVFVSCTSRWTGDMNETEIPGPSNTFFKIIIDLFFNRSNLEKLKSSLKKTASSE